MKFLCDIMVQKLGRILILTGFDVKIIKNPLQLDEICHTAVEEKRIILTRNTKIKEKKAPYLLLIEQNPYKQFERVVKELNLKIDEKNFFTRCSICNTQLEKIEKEKIFEKIPTFTRQNTDEFFICPVCAKIYWHQSHLDLFKKKIKTILNF